jgi:hypothetical protein
MFIDSLMAVPGADVNYDAGFRILIEDHMTYLRSHTTTSVLTVDGSMAYKYVGDLSGLLTHYQVPRHLHWVVMRMNNMTSNTDLTESTTSLILPDLSTVSKLSSTYRTKK